MKRSNFPFKTFDEEFLHLVCEFCAVEIVVVCPLVHVRSEGRRRRRGEGGEGETP